MILDHASTSHFSIFWQVQNPLDPFLLKLSMEYTDDVDLSSRLLGYYQALIFIQNKTNLENVVLFGYRNGLGSTIWFNVLSKMANSVDYKFF